MKSGELKKWAEEHGGKVKRGNDYDEIYNPKDRGRGVLGITSNDNEEISTSTLNTIKKWLALLGISVLIIMAIVNGWM